MFEFLASDPNAVGFLYFDIDKERDWAIYENGTVPTQWQQGMQAASTSYQFPLENWFAPGELVVDTANQISLGCFADVENSQFQLEIDWLVNAGITVGCGNSRFCPTRAVTRAQMASFLVRALDLPPTVSDHFADDSGSIHQADINALAEAGITTGCSMGAYCPDGTTTRAQMATFLTRALGLGAAPTDYYSDDAGLVHEQDINSVALSGITRGCGPALYCPNSTVTREQMAAFLHRTFASPGSG
jgi:hypothetical protein